MILSRGTYVALSMETFVAFDLETTGLDPEEDEILEVGMVRVEQGNITERYSQLFLPSVPIPHFITQLTGITPEDCIDQPSIEEKFQDIVKFLGNEWIIAHNAIFDLSFLQKAWARFYPLSPPVGHERIMDTLELSRILFPLLPNHKLETVAEYLHAPVLPEHRALADAEAAAHIFNEILHQVLGLDGNTVQTILRILNGAHDGLRLFFERVAGMMKETQFRKPLKKAGGPVNIIGQVRDRSYDQTKKKIDQKEITNFFKPDGVLSESLPRYEFRKPQQEMAVSVCRDFNNDSFLLAEAGTGVGKSLAYLVPAVMWITSNSGSKVIISTHTKTLQSQLFSKELPLLNRVMEANFQAVLLKGRANYICLKRWKNFLFYAEERLTIEQRRKLLPLVLWVTETLTGDIEENAGFGEKRNREIWAQLLSDGTQCSGSQCALAEECFFQKVRRAARSAGIVVVNHSLLFADVATDFSVLNEYDSLIVDEAHQIERVASQSIGKSLQLWMFREISLRLFNSGSVETGFLVTIQRVIKKTTKNDGMEIEAGRVLQKLKDLSEEMWQEACQFFQALGEIATGKDYKTSVYAKYRIRESDEIFNPLRQEVERLESILKGVTSNLARLTSLLGELVDSVSPKMEELNPELDSIIDQISALGELFNYFTRDNYQGAVVWCEVSQQREHKNITLYSVPLNIAELLSDLLYPRLKRCLMTSATLAVSGQFDYIMGRLGLDRMEPERLSKKTFGSPFDYSQQANFLIPTFLSSPKLKTFTADVSDLLIKVLSIHSRGTMVLFTSHKMLREVYKSVRPVMEGKGIRLLGQGISGPRSTLLKIFREDRQSVLLGTNSFWEGVDVPGNALELLIITKIPFDVPTDPLVEARLEQVQGETGNGFLNYSVPEAIVRFRQGFGRLIRSGEDMGVILLLDNRIVNTQYGSLFLGSLPLKAEICHKEDTLMEALEEWF